MLTKCTICDLPAGSFDQTGLGFKAHVRWEHNVWDYYYLFAYLQLKDDLEYSGVESDIARRLLDPSEAKTIFPVHQATCLTASLIARLLLNTAAFRPPIQHALCISYYHIWTYIHK